MRRHGIAGEDDPPFHRLDDDHLRAGCATADTHQPHAWAKLALAIDRDDAAGVDQALQQVSMAKEARRRRMVPGTAGEEVDLGALLMEAGDRETIGRGRVVPVHMGQDDAADFFCQDALLGQPIDHRDDADQTANARLVRRRPGVDDDDCVAVT